MSSSSSSLSWAEEERRAKEAEGTKPRRAQLAAAVVSRPEDRLWRDAIRYILRKDSIVLRGMGFAESFSIFAQENLGGDCQDETREEED